MGYSSISKCTEDLFIVKENNYYGVVNFAGTELLPTIYSRIFNIKHNFAVVGVGNDKGVVSLLDKSDVIAINNINQEIFIISSEYLKIRRNNKYGIVNILGMVLIPFEFDRIIEFQTSDSVPVSLFLLLKQVANNKFKVGLAASDGTILINADTYDFISPFKSFDGYSIFILDGKRGLLNKNNVIVLPNEYDDIRIGTGSKFVCKKNNVYYLFDANTQTLIEINGCDYIEKFTSLYAVFRFNSKKGVIDWSGNKVIDSNNMDVLLFEKLTELSATYSCWVKNIENPSYQLITFPPQ